MRGCGTHAACTCMVVALLMDTLAYTIWLDPPFGRQYYLPKSPEHFTSTINWYPTWQIRPLYQTFRWEPKSITMISMNNIMPYDNLHVHVWWYFKYKGASNDIQCNLSNHDSRQPRWLSGLTRSLVHSLMIARHCVLSNPGQGSKRINLSGWHGLDMSVTVTKRH